MTETLPVAADPTGILAPVDNSAPSQTVLTVEEKVDEIHAAIKNIERILVEDLAPMVGPALAGLEPILGKLNGPMGAILGSMLR